MKFQSSDYSTREILRHPDFERLCNKLKSQAGIIDLHDTVEALKVVSYVGAPPESTIVRVLLQLLRQNINDLNINQIIFLDFLLNQMKRDTALVKALKIALPLVFEIQLQTKVDASSVNQLADCLYFAIKHGLRDDTIEFLVRKLTRIGTEFDMKTAKSIVWSICDTQFNERLQPLMKKSIKSLVIHMDQMNYVDIDTTISKLTSRHRRNNVNDYFYDLVFFDCCVNWIIDNDCGFKEAIYFIRKLARIDYACDYLLDYVTAKITDKPSLISSGDITDIYSIVYALPITDYKPKNWEFLSNLISNANIAVTNERPDVSIKFASSLCLLGIYNVDLLAYALQEKTLNTLFKRGFASDFDNYLVIYQSLKLYKPELEYLVPKRISPAFLAHNIQSGEYPLEAALRQAYGGEMYVKSGLYSKLGHKIDHVVVFRKGGFPVSLTIEEHFLEDVQLSPNSQLVIIKGLEPFRYTSNTRKLKGISEFFLKTLETFGFPVVAINVEAWNNLEEFEKIPYLTQKVREKLQDSEFSEQSL